MRIVERGGERIRDQIVRNKREMRGCLSGLLMKPMAEEAYDSCFTLMGISFGSLVQLLHTFDKHQRYSMITNTQYSGGIAYPPHRISVLQIQRCSGCPVAHLPLHLHQEWPIRFPRLVVLSSSTSSSQVSHTTLRSKVSRAGRHWSGL